ncbi:type 2 isopentenyl-diphosphate Delta-isomerase [Xanthobacter sp. DSM 24535]|uniref:type 2 isopentenyl-diphosphate Delta-isomerase n=1 Tax=Roseixanthobacter psychrophilus TaxID=3119917 RepID=UPI0037267B34
MNAESEIQRRKQDHIDVVMADERTLSRAKTGFESVFFEHRALPELHLDAVDLTTTFLGRALAAPLLISSMTGGPAAAGLINRHLAEAAQHLGIALGVGSQRVALEGGEAAGLDPGLRRLAPGIPLFANLGAAQLARGYGLDEARRAVDMIEADALILHLNPLQEAVQAGGDRDWRGLLDAIGSLARALPAPMIVKEVGFGIAADLARQLVDNGVAAIDVAGAGGTNWALVEGERGSGRQRAIAAAFADWGIPTAQAVQAVREACPKVPLIASGGLKDGVDVAKAIRLGADLAGQAAGVLSAAVLSSEAVVAHFEGIITQLRIACFCTGSTDLAALRTARLLPAA